MDTCAAEIGLLKKHPCGQNAVAHCANCEMALCTKHAVPQLTATKQRTGKFMCAECDKAQKAADKGMAHAPQHHTPAKPGAPAARPAAPAAHAAPKPAVTPAQAGAAPKPAAPAPKPAAPAPAAAKEEKFKLEETGPIEFTPTKKP